MTEPYKGSKRRGKAVFHVHSSDDWCHLCGDNVRALVDVWFPRIAEHDKPVKDPPGPCYTRICWTCLEFGVDLLKETQNLAVKADEQDPIEKESP